MKENNKINKNSFDTSDKELYRALGYTATILGIMWGLSFILN